MCVLTALSRHNRKGTRRRDGGRRNEGRGEGGRRDGGGRNEGRGEGGRRVDEGEGEREGVEEETLK